MAKHKVVVTKICRCCGNPFDIPRWKHHQLYCSTKCKKESQIIKLDYNEILNDKSWETHKVTKNEKRKIRNYFDNKCAYCGRLLSKCSGDKSKLVRIPLEFSNGSDIVVPICFEDYNNMLIDEYTYLYYIYEEVLKIIDKKGN
jgi:hypothetical protein